MVPSNHPHPHNLNHDPNLSQISINLKILTCDQLFNKLLIMLMLFLIFFLLIPILFVIPSASYLIKMTLGYLDYHSTIYSQFYQYFNTKSFYEYSLTLGYCVLGLWAAIGGAFVVYFSFKIYEFFFVAKK